MRRITLYALTLAALSGCYSPDYSSKPCTDNAGCPSSYFCDTTRATAAAAGTCTMGVRTDGGGVAGDLAGADMSPAVPPLTLTEYIIPAGTFILGSNLGDVSNSNDAPAYQRTMPALCVEEKEVTVAAYTKCVQAGQCNPPVGNSAGCNYGVSGREDHPVNCVEYAQAEAFCKWIGRRLPTESEWEYAANGPTTSTGEKYPWAGAGGSFVAAKACFNNGGTCPAGSKVHTFQGVEVAATSPGFYDFAGNVWEWTSSEFCPYNMAMPDRTCGIPAWVVRGGSGFDNDGRLLRSTIRLRNAKTAANVDATYLNSWVNNAGFRCFGDVSANNTCIK